jgi:predicted AlkP superfamily pyrophosphatase or phosphodiesterase
VADHQLAHIYVADPADVSLVKSLLERIDGVEEVLDEAGKVLRGLDHPRSGELVAIARADAWFTYYYWQDDAKAPDYARTVEIHRKPGYDPVELFVDPALGNPKVAVGWRLLKRKLGLRTLLDVIPLDASLVKGSHGRPTDDPREGPVFITSEPDLAPERPVSALEVKAHILAHVFD